MKRARHSRRRRRPIGPVIGLLLVGAGGWWFWPRGNHEARANDAVTSPVAAADQRAPVKPSIPTVVLTEAKSDPTVPLLSSLPLRHSDESSSRPEPKLVENPPTDPEPKQPKTLALSANMPEEAPSPAGPQLASAKDDDPKSSRSPDRAAMDATLKKYAAGKKIEARRELNAMLSTTTDSSLQRELRKHLARIADETIFSREIIDGDPLFERYKIQSGDYLITIGKKFDVPADVLMLINNIQDPTKIRAGQALKAPRGPFNAKISKSQFRIDLYLGDLYVRSYPVGIGRSQGTPSGVWRVKERLENPTYYPPASAEDKRIIPGHDPKNPLGGRWIGLEGIEGDAVGQIGFGVHGTIEPDSIGKEASLGCIRMHNEDVAFVYKLMMPGKSKVTTLP